MKGKPLLFRWRNAFMGPDGPPASTRLVLHTLAAHMEKDGTKCFPGLRRIESETNLSRRAVIDHIRAAELGGWIRVTEMTGGPGGRYHLYTPTLPNVVSQVHHEGYKRGEPATPPRGEPHAPNVVNQVHPSSPVVPQEQPHTPPRAVSLEDFLSAYPGSQHNSDKVARALTGAIGRGADLQAIVEGAKRYSAYCVAGGVSGPKYIKRADNWLGEDGWCDPWVLTEVDAVHGEPTGPVALWAPGEMVPVRTERRPHRVADGVAVAESASRGTPGVRAPPPPPGRKGGSRVPIR